MWRAEVSVRLQGEGRGVSEIAGRKKGWSGYVIPSKLEMEMRKQLLWRESERSVESLLIVWSVVEQWRCWS